MAISRSRSCATGVLGQMTRMSLRGVVVLWSIVLVLVGISAFEISIAYRNRAA